MKDSNVTEKMKIPVAEVNFHKLSTFDENGRLFRWRGTLYRVISAGYEDVCRELFERGIVRKLIQKGLMVETEMTELSLDGFSLVLKHREIPFISYHYEWCPEMLKAAALNIIDMETELAKDGFELQDAHPFNVLFDGCRPVFVDFSSIMRIDDSEHLWRAHKELYLYFLYPLKLMGRGYGSIVRKMLLGFFNGISEEDFNHILHGPKQPKVFLPWNIRGYVKNILKQCIPTRCHAVAINTYRSLKGALIKEKTSLNARRFAFLAKLRKETEDICFPQVATEWSNYYDNRFLPLEPSGDWSSKHRNVYQILSQLRPRSVLDIGSNRGWYSQLASVLGSSVVAFDEDEMAVNKLFRDSKEKKLPILPLIMDFRNPSPGYGFSQWLSPGTQRLKCEMVLALALVHHLAFHKFRLNFDQITEAFSSFTERWLLVEFIPQEDQYVSKWCRTGYSWYTQDNFINALKKRYSRIQVYPSAPGPRTLILCEK